MLLKKLKYYFLNASVLSFCSVFLQCELNRREDAAGLKEGLAELLDSIASVLICHSGSSSGEGDRG